MGKDLQTPMLATSALCAGHNDKPVLQGLDLEVRPGEMTALLGPNGSGKTTLLLTLAGALPLLGGAVRLKGRDLSRLKPRATARLAASVPQRADSGFPLLCLSVTLMGRYPYLSFLGAYSKQDREIALTAMERTGCAHLAHRPVHAISGGELQRVLVARALAQETDLLLLDEPAANLDVAATVRIFDLLRAGCGQGKAVLAAAHDLNLAALYCERMIFLKNKGIAAQGSTRDVFTEQNLTDIYETPISIVEHPVTGAPQALFAPGAAC